MDVDQDMDLLSSFTAYLSNLKSVEDISEEECSKFVNGISSKNIQLVQLVERLGPFLLDTDNSKREQGCLVLASILSLLSNDALSSMEVDFIARFLIERLKDHHSVIPSALMGTLAIAKMKNVNDGIAAEFFSTAFIHFYCQSQRHDDRNTFYQIICRFMDTKSPELLAMGTDFVYGVISSMDGEKDPRNLMLLFTKLVPKFVTTFKLGHLTEETFEVLGCYFPVDFQPLSNDPAAITRADLSSALQPCLVAIPDFAEFTVPIALEKLVSSLPVAKVDSLKLLVESCSKFPAAKLMPHITMIWHTLRSEILTCVGDPELRDLSYQVLYCLVKNLSCSALNAEQLSIYNGLLHDIFVSMRGYLSDLSLSLFNPICKLLETVASSSHSSCSFMMSRVVSILVALSPKSPSESVTLLKAISVFLQVCFQMQVLPDELAELQANYIKIVTLYLSALSSDIEDEILEGAEGFKIILPLLTEDERTQFYDVLSNLLLKNLNSFSRIQLLKCMKAAAHQYPDEVLNQLVGGALQINQGSEIATQERGLTVLCYLSDQEPFFSLLFSHIKSITDTVSKEGIEIFLSCYKNLIEGEHIELLKRSSVVFALISGVLQMDCTDDNFFKLLENFYYVVNSMMLRLDDRRDEAELVSHFLPKLLNEVQHSAESTETAKIKILFLLSSLLTRLQMQIDESATSEIYKFCLDLIFLTTKPEVNLHASRLIALLVNKASELDANLKLEKIQKYLAEKENSGNDTVEIDVHYLCRKAYLVGWVVKALNSSNHPSSGVWIDTLINLLGIGVDENKLEAAHMFRIIVEDDPYFSVASCCNIKLFHRQRLFQCVPKLVELSKSAQFKTSYLMAVLYQLNHIPSQVLNMYLSKVLPVLIETLKLESLQQLQLPALKITSSLLQEKSNLLQPHLGTFMTLFLNLAKSSPQMKIRMAALQCLFDCSLFEESVILPQKSIVLQELIPCLDDKKRLVRREAVRTRSRWFLVGSPIG